MSAILQTATLDEIRNAAARICRDYLHGHWKTVTAEQLIVKRISGGLSNFLYYVSLPADDGDELEPVPGSDETKTTLAQQISCKNVINTSLLMSPVLATAYDKNSSNGNNNNNNNSNNNVQHATKRQPELLDGKLYTSMSEVSADAGETELAQNDVLKPHKRKRIDSDSSYLSASKRIQAMKNEPREVLLRIYGQTHGDDALESMITESVVFALLSERNFGPKLHGIFPGGRIEQYIPARSLSTQELSEHRLSMKIAEKMGEIHSLNIPMSKEPDWIWNCMKRWLKSLDSIVKGTIDSQPNSTVFQKQRNLLSTIDYKKEMKWLNLVIEQGNYVVRFCHNDLQEGNILLRQPGVGQDSSSSPRISISSLRSNFDETLGESLDGNANSDVEPSLEQHITSPCSELLDTTDDSALDTSFTTENEPDLIIIDFEYCAYNYRGFDLANHFVEWTFDYTNPEFPYFYSYMDRYPTKQQRRDFIVTYLKKYHDNDEYEPTLHELNALDEEVKVFRMFSHLFWSLWSVVNVTSSIEFGYCDYAEARILAYQKLKAAYLKEQQQQE